MSNVDYTVYTILRHGNLDMHPLAVSSLQTGLYATLRALGVGGGSIVLCDPIFPFAALATLHAGAVPVFPSIKDEEFPTSYIWDVPTITEIKAAIITAIFDHIPEFELKSYSADRPRIVIDAALTPLLDISSHNYSYDVLGYSFASGKPISCGEGGLLLFKELELCQNTLRWSRFGICDEDDCLKQPLERPPGLNFLMSPALPSILAESCKQLYKIRDVLTLSWNAIMKSQTLPGVRLDTTGSLGWYQAYFLNPGENYDCAPLYLESDGIRWKRCILRDQAVSLVTDVPKEIVRSAKQFVNRLVWYRPEKKDGNKDNEDVFKTNKRRVCF